MNLAGKKILVTGAAGSLGGQIIRDLADRGLSPIAHVRVSSDTTQIDRLGLEKRTADLRNGRELLAIMQGIDAVIHCAALVEFRADRLTQFTGTNVMGALDMYEAARRSGVERFVHVSTVGAVGARPRNGAPAGAHEREPLTEEHSFNLDHLRIPYIMTKRAAENELLKVTDPASPELVIVNPSIILSPTFGGPDLATVRTYFNRLWLPDLDNLLNLVDVRDVSSGTIAALRKGRPGHRYILAGDDIEARELVLMVSHLVGKTPHLVRIPRSVIDLAARLSFFWARLSNRGRIGFYPDLVRMLDFDWTFSSEKARHELGYQSRALLVSLSDLLSSHSHGPS
ncbi:NAD-dependent epimerase/dehydratase family protein [bacterium]|nr:NAD-dependent epimerase/dehydratase family protein [bacterium]